MSGPSGEPAAAAPVVTLVAGSTFCLSGRSGDIEPAAGQGLFFHDTRILSTWRLRLDGRPAQVVAVLPAEPYAGLFVLRIPLARSGTDVLVERRRFVGQGMREDIRLRNVGDTHVRTVLSIDVEADLADLFAVKESRVTVSSSNVWSFTEGASLTIGNKRRGVRVDAGGARAHPGQLEFRVDVPARGEWSTSIFVRPTVDGQEVASSFPVGRPVEESPPAVQARELRSSSARITTESAALRKTVDRSQDDLASLRIVDPAHPESVALAAGAPWFLALFGRDSLLASYMALPFDPSLAVGTLQSLARVQGTKVDPRTEEQPGRIVHETRLGLDFPLVHGGGSAYYGTADATPLFVVLLGELRRWGALSAADAETLLPHADRALEWVERYGDRDGDGFVEYERMTPHGLRNQGWKDSEDAVNFADGRLATPPIALCEVQAYVYAAYVARARFAEEADQPRAARAWRDRAGRLREAFHEQFWLPQLGWFAVGLDRDKRPVDALTSNIGHCLWAGIVDEDKAGAVAEHLMSPEMFSGWGVRTLASSMGAYNPMSYHNGSVWPHDNALLAAGLMRYGFVEPAQRIALGILDAAEAFDGRLPELFCGFDRSDYPVPLPYPTSCSPQAAAAATPLHLLRTLLRLDPAVPRGEVSFAPVWPTQYGRLSITELPLGHGDAGLWVDGGSAGLTGLDAVDVLPTPRAARED